MMQNLPIQWACCIFPCNPFIDIGDLHKAANLAETQKVDFVYPVTEYRHPTARAMTRNEAGSMSFIDPESELKRTRL